MDGDPLWLLVVGGPGHTKTETVQWARNVGTEGDRTLVWQGHLTLIGAVTTAWDSHHSVMATMGDRFLVLRSDSTEDDLREACGTQSLDNTSSEVRMRCGLAEVMPACLPLSGDGWVSPSVPPGDVLDDGEHVAG